MYFYLSCISKPYVIKARRLIYHPTVHCDKYLEFMGDTRNKMRPEFQLNEDLHLKC